MNAKNHDSNVVKLETHQPKPIRFGSVCSGIEAASVAWHPIGWESAWFSEIEPFPSAVLTHHFPDVPNLGDMTKIRDRIASGEVFAPDILVGGTPCQAFSVAGARKSLDDDRGQLTLEYVRLANEIDATRLVRGEQPVITVWENVPGVLSTKDNAFGCFLGALSGEDCELQPSGKKWTNAGCVFGPQRTVAWRVLDAQYFGVAQRRRRVFVVASARKGFNPTEVLFEFDGVRRDSAPSRSAGQEVTRSTGESVKTASYWDGKQLAGTLTKCGMNQLMPDKNNAQLVVYANGGDVCDTVTRKWAKGSGGPAESETGNLAIHHQVVHGTQDPIIQPVDNNPKLYDAYQHHGWREGETCGTLTVGQNNTIRGDTPVVIHATQDNQAFPLGCNHGQENAVFGRKPENGGNATEPMDNIAPCQTKTDRHAVAYAFDSLSSNSMKSPNPNSGCREVDLAKTLDTTDPNPSKNQGGIGILQSQAFGIQGSMIGRSLNAGPQGSGISDGVSFTLTKGDRHAVAVTDVAGTLTLGFGARGVDSDQICNGNCAISSGLVRRLTPIECERLQGFPDNWTQIPYRKKPADQCPDGPRYAACGNSMAVPVMQWIGQRIQDHIDGKL